MPVGRAGSLLGEPAEDAIAGPDRDVYEVGPARQAESLRGLSRPADRVQQKVQARTCTGAAAEQPIPAGNVVSQDAGPLPPRGTRPTVSMPGLPRGESVLVGRPDQPSPERAARQPVNAAGHNGGRDPAL